MTSKSTTVDLDVTATPVVVDNTSQTTALIGLLEGLLAEAKASGEVKVFSSGNTGVYANKRLKAPDARALGLLVPTGGKVALSLQAVVIDPANSKDA